MTQAEFNQSISEMKHRADEIALAIPSAGEEDLVPLVWEYVRCKYLLTPEEMTTDNLSVLGRISTEKLIGIRNSGIEYKDKAAGCTSASSDVIKKILLAMALGRILETKLNPDDVANVVTINDLVELLLQTKG